MSTEFRMFEYKNMIHAAVVINQGIHVDGICPLNDDAVCSMT